jgi:hypothetical protein
MDKVVDSIRAVKGPTGPRSQERAASLLAGSPRAVAATPRAARAGKGQGPPGRPHV